MARPLRNAARRAAELIAKGYGIEQIDAIGSQGLTSAEEDDLNAEIAAAYEPVEEEYGPDENEGVAETSSDVQANGRLKSYGDTDEDPPSDFFMPKDVPGPHLLDRITRGGIQNYTRAIDFFHLFFSDEMLEEVVENTNLYAWVHILDKPSYSKVDGSWEPTNVQELKNMIALIIFHGFAGRVDMERDWSQATLYSGGWARRFLSKNRFKALSGMLHVSKPGEEDANDKLAKVRPLIDHMRQCCRTFFNAYQSVSIDERMVRGKGRSPIKQYMPDKPTRFGYKLWCICDAHTGYTVDFSIYIGKSTERSKHGLGYDVVTALVSPLYGQGVHVYCDNFFTSDILAKHLLENDTFMCGTTQPWRRGFPQCMKDKAWSKKASRGDMRYTRKDHVLYIQWLDKQVVNMMSTMHKADESGKCRRRGKNKQGVYQPVTLRIPSCFKEYNKKMGGVDLADQMIETYNCLIKSTRWWKTLFFHMIDMAILNSFLLFKMWRKMHPEIPGLKRCAGFSHINFREELVRQLANIDDDEYTPIYEPAFKRRKSLLCSGPHNPEYTKTRRNCAVCYWKTGRQVKSYIRCAEPQCQVHLCLNASRNCFPVWHSPECDMLRKTCK